MYANLVKICRKFGGWNTFGINFTKHGRNFGATLPQNDQGIIWENFVENIEKIILKRF